MVWRFIKKYFGWRNWAVFSYNSIFENLFLVFFITLTQSKLSNNDILHILYFLVFSFFSTTYGYLINDYADQELDRKHKKSNTFMTDSKGKASWIVILALLLSILTAVPFFSNYYFDGLFGLWIFLATAYSIKPFRFKERGWTGLFIVAISQRFLPILLLFTVFKLTNSIDWILFGIYIFLRGFVSDMNHQLVDFVNDQKTDTKTYAVQYGLNKLKKMFQIMLIAERYALFFLLIYIALRLINLRIYSVPVFIFPAILYLLLLMLARLSFTRDKKTETNPFAIEKNIYQVIHLVFPNIFLPVYFIFITGLLNPAYWLFLLFYIILFRLYDPNTLKNFFFLKWFFDKRAA